jgi:hypothetical protein
VVRQGLTNIMNPMRETLTDFADSHLQRAAQVAHNRILEMDLRQAEAPAAPRPAIVRPVLPPQVPAAPANTQYLNDLIRARNAMVHMYRRPITDAEAALFQRDDIPANPRLISRAIHEQYQIFAEYGHDRAFVEMTRRAGRALPALPNFGHRGPGGPGGPGAFPRP